MKKIRLTYNELNQLDVAVYTKNFSRDEGLSFVLLREDADEILTIILYMSEYDVDKCKTLLKQKPKKIMRYIEINDRGYIYSDDSSKIDIRLLLDKLIKDLDTMYQ